MTTPVASRAEPTVAQLFNLTGKRALITGATGHLGSAMARALAEAGASVVATSRDEQRARAVAAALPSPAGAQHFGTVLDQMTPDVLDEQFSAVVKTAG